MRTRPSAVPRGYSFYHKLFFLYLLNLCDWLCTEVLLRSGRFFEANPLMQPVVQQLIPALLLKGVLPLFLSLACALVFRLSGLRETRFGNFLLNIGIFVYSLVNLRHILNFLLLFSSV